MPGGAAELGISLSPGPGGGDLSASDRWSMSATDAYGYRIPVDIDAPEKFPAANLDYRFTPRPMRDNSSSPIPDQGRLLPSSIKPPDNGPSDHITHLWEHIRTVRNCLTVSQIKKRDLAGIGPAKTAERRLPSKHRRAWRVQFQDRSRVSISNLPPMSRLCAGPVATGPALGLPYIL